MEYHDFHLRGYTVGDFGSVVTLELVYDYPDRPKRESAIRFDGVRLYHFEHTAGAIISSIEEIPVAIFVAKHSKALQTWAMKQGLNDWRSDIQQLAGDWMNQGLRAWTIDSAIGFGGYVVAKAVEGS